MIQIHRFWNRCAVNLPGTHATVYLEREDAEKLARLMLECCNDIAARKFGPASQFHTCEWQQLEKTNDEP